MCLTGGGYVYNTKLMINFATYNVWGLGEVGKRNKIFKYLRDKYHDVIFIQESHSTKRMGKIWRSQWGGSILYAHNSSNTGGTCILFKRKLKTKVHQVIKQQLGRYLIVDITINQERFLLCNVYAPDEDDLEFFVDLFSQVEKVNKTSKNDPYIVISGDFNTILNTKDKRGGVT